MVCFPIDSRENQLPQYGGSGSTKSWRLVAHPPAGFFLAFHQGKRRDCTRNGTEIRDFPFFPNVREGFRTAATGLVITRVTKVIPVI